MPSCCKTKSQLDFIIYSDFESITVKNTLTFYTEWRARGFLGGYQSNMGDKREKTKTEKTQ